MSQTREGGVCKCKCLMFFLPELRMAYSSGLTEGGGGWEKALFSSISFEAKQSY